jgi:hypothetical protein
MKFLAQTMAVLHTPGEQSSHEGFCFKKLTYSYTSDAQKLTVKITAEDAVDWTCSDVHMVMVGRRWQTKNVFFKGDNILTFDNLTQQDLDLVDARGVIAYEFCDSA